MRVLVCDDDQTSLTLVTLLLKKMQLEVEATTDPKQALWTLLSPHAPKVALLDWMMPELSGLDIVKRVRVRSTPIATYLILVTARGEAEDLAEGLDAGANDYVTKPFNELELRARVQAGLRIAQLEQELKTLSGILPICAWCKNIRDEGDEWVRMEAYVEKHSEAHFTHGACPDCLAKMKSQRPAG